LAVDGQSGLGDVAVDRAEAALDRLEQRLDSRRKFVEAAGGEVVAIASNGRPFVGDLLDGPCRDTARARRPWP